MKTFIRILVIYLLFALSNSIYAQEIVFIKNDLGQRPENVICAEPHCEYVEGSLTISFNFPVGDAVLSIIPMNGGDVDVLEQVIFSTETPYTIYMGEPAEPVEIVITTNNAEYTAVLP